LKYIGANDDTKKNKGDYPIVILTIPKQQRNLWLAIWAMPKRQGIPWPTIWAVL
jgi:hypothetical protein